MSAELQIAFGERADELGKRYSIDGRVQIHDALEADSARRIYDCLVEHRRWNLVYRLGGKHIAGSANAIAQWPPATRRKLEKGIYAEARQGFQYFFASVPIYDIVHGNLLPGHLFTEIFDLLNGTEMLTAVRRIINDDSVAYADAQATRFESGHFLTAHDDAVKGKNRRAAYVLNLTPSWHPDWGGALQFIGEDANFDAAWLPRFNVLNIFRVPSRHSVGIVAPFAGAPRYAITGWFRSGVDDAASSPR